MGLQVDPDELDDRLDVRRVKAELLSKEVHEEVEVGSKAYLFEA